MARRFNPFQQRAPQNFADLISGLLGDAQQGLVRGQQIRQTREEGQRVQGLEREEIDFDRAMQMAELELAQDANARAQEKPEKPVTSREGVLAGIYQGALGGKGISPQDRDLINEILESMKKPDKPAKPASTAGARTAEIKGFLSGREKVPQTFDAFNVLGKPIKQTKLVDSPFTQGTRDSISAIAQGQPFPIFPAAETSGQLTAEQAQHRAALNQKYGEDIVQQIASKFTDFDTAPFDDKVKTIETLLRQ